MLRICIDIKNAGLYYSNCSERRKDFGPEVSRGTLFSRVSQLDLMARPPASASKAAASIATPTFIHEIASTPTAG